ncbi:MAG: DUF6789 family protein [Thermodesulfobacteriota bacterium]
MSDILAAIVAGLLGTGAMSVFMWLIHRLGWANADMIRAIGSIFTKSYDNALVPGFVAHFIVGVVIAFGYVAFTNLFSISSFLAFLVIGGMLSIFHGLVFSFLLVVMVAQHHPLEQFQKAGSEVAVAHFIGHLIYGVVVSAVLGLTTPALF